MCFCASGGEHSPVRRADWMGRGPLGPPIIYWLAVMLSSMSTCAGCIPCSSKSTLSVNRRFSELIDTLPWGSLRYSRAEGFRFLLCTLKFPSLGDTSAMVPCTRALPFKSDAYTASGSCSLIVIALNKVKFESLRSVKIARCFTHETPLKPLYSNGLNKNTFCYRSRSHRASRRDEVCDRFCGF